MRRRPVSRKYPQASQKLEQLQGSGGVTGHYGQHQRYRQSELDANASATLGRLEMATVRRGHGRKFRVTDVQCRRATARAGDRATSQHHKGIQKNEGLDAKSATVAVIAAAACRTIPQ